MTKEPCQTRISFDVVDEGIQFAFTDYPKDTEWNPEMPVTYLISFSHEEFAEFSKKIGAELRRVVGKPSLWQRVKAAFK